MANFVKKKEPKHDSNESSSSAEAEMLKSPKDVLELGIHLVQQLRLQSSNDTLARWMVHHLAELMTRAEHAQSEQARSAATESAVTLILTIWEHRANLPHGM